MKFRIEKDSLGSIQVPADKLYGPQTARAVINFPISNERFSADFIKALAIVKHACARANQDLGFLSKSKARAIIRASDEIMRGEHADQFPISIWQSGSGTQTNMNINEVIAKRSAQFLKTRTTAKQLVHPNDDVNHGQSSNDVIPTAMHVAAVLAVKNDLIPSLKQLHLSLREKSKAFKKIIKIGRTHLMDATPLSLGAEFSAYATQIENNLARLNAGLPHLYQLALGATAVGTGVNAHPRFSKKAIGCISQMTKQPFKPASNKYEAIAAHDALVQLSATFKTLAVSLMKIANDIRLLGSGPRCGIGELILPANEPGSSIMPGKVNPTQCESLAMVCAQVIGYDAAITIAGAGGHFQLNTYKPLIIHNVLSAVRLLSDASLSFSQRCVQGIRPNHTRIKEYVDRSLMLVTALAPRIGYDHAAQIAQDAHRKGITLRQAALESGLVDKKTYDTLINPNKMIRS